MSPEITIIIPVYKVEQYLRQCLDSVVNQTMRDIQIICVNDGSPDNSRTILQEYAERDARIEIIDKPNGGLSSARNAALPFVQGKYIMFVDSDDWIDRDCCEKVFAKAEQTGADITIFFYQREGITEQYVMYDSITPSDKRTVEEKISLFRYPTACGKLWRTQFFIGGKFAFPEGLAYEDNYVHWMGVTQASCISVVPEKFYHYRYVPDSIVNSHDKNACDYIRIFQLVEKYLDESGYMQTYKDIFLKHKLGIYHYACHLLLEKERPLFLGTLRRFWSKKDREFCRNASSMFLDTYLREFYLSHGFGGWRGTLKYHLISILKYYLTTSKGFFFKTVKWPERLLRHGVIKPLKKLLGIQKQSPTGKIIK